MMSRPSVSLPMASLNGMRRWWSASSLASLSFTNSDSTGTVIITAPQSSNSFSNALPSNQMRVQTGTERIPSGFSYQMKPWNSGCKGGLRHWRDSRLSMGVIRNMSHANICHRRQRALLPALVKPFQSSIPPSKSLLWRPESKKTAPFQVAPDYKNRQAIRIKAEIVYV